RFRVPISVMPHALVMPPPELIRRSEIGIRDDHYLFLFLFDMSSELERKNPFGLIRAFRRAFLPDEKVTLLLKLVRGELDPAGTARLEAAAGDANIVIVNEVVSRERALGFVKMSDCYVSLHRSEGFGLALAEAMALGKPVISTGYSGNLDFMNAGNSFLVDYTIVPVESEGPNYRCGGRWAEPSEEHAATLIRSVWLDPGMAANTGEQARLDVVAQLATEAIGVRMRSRLREIAAGP
ncbi:MAG TPA: glycosyltransferase, partial [Chthoniobacterales bacterium]|nr:glycosyltransferase [Chthoniobacterales bacterium]